MPQSSLENVEAHWSKLVENFQTSPKDYYDAVEAIIVRRKTP